MIVNVISLKTVSPIDLKLEICYIIKRTDPTDFGPYAKKTRWPPSYFLKCVLQTPPVNAISLESFHQSTSNLIYDVIPHAGRTLLNLGQLFKSRWPLSNFVYYRHPL